MKAQTNIYTDNDHTGICLCCENPTYTVDDTFCMPCLIGQTQKRDYRFALDAAIYGRSGYVAKAKAAEFLMAHPSLLLLDFEDLKTINNNVCVQVNKEYRWRAVQRVISKVSSQQARGQAVNKCLAGDYGSKVAEILTEKLTEQGGLCPYCSQTLRGRGITLETVRPLPWSHGSYGGYRAAEYAELLQADLAVLACWACNSAKGNAESAGKWAMWNWMRGKYVLQPYATPARKLRPRLLYDWDRPLLRSGHSNEANNKARLALMRAWACRISRLCFCEYERLEIQWLPRAGNLVISCQQHTLANAVPLGYLALDARYTDGRPERTRNLHRSGRQKQKQYQGLVEKEAGK